MKHFFLLILSSFVFLGCGLEVESVNNEKFKQDQINDLKRDYKIVEGLYEGELVSRNGEKYPIQIKLHVTETLGAPGADGKPIPKVQLVGRFRRTDIVQTIDYMTFTSDFNVSTKAITMSYSSDKIDPFFGQAENTSIYGTFHTNEFKGYYSVDGGVVGDISVKRISKDVKGKSRTEEINEYHDRLFKMYDPIIGKYEGELKTNNGTHPVEIKIHVIEKLVSPGADSKPVKRLLLLGRYRRTDIVQPIDYMTFTSDFDATADSIKMNYINEGSDPDFGQAENTTIYGDIKSGRISGYFSVDGGIVGEIVVKRISKEAKGKSRSEEINEYHERLYNIYKPMVGIYEDCLRSSNGNAVYPVLLNLTISYNNEKPYIRGVINRTDYTSPIDLDTNFTYDQETREVTIEPLRNSIPGRPSAHFYANGTFRSGVLSLNNFSDRNGIVGNGKYRATKGKRLKSGYCNKK